MSGAGVDTAVVALLQADATLASLAPGGVWRDVAPEGAVDQGVFVIVQLQAHEDVDEQAQRVGYEIPRYLAKAVSQDSDGAAAAAAYARVHALLQGQALTITGYHHMDTRRESRVSYTEPDGAVLWKHDGGLYRVEAHPV